MKQVIRYCNASDGERIAYAEYGTGTPLVMTANWLSHLAFDQQSPVWRHWLIELSKTHRLVKYDERGSGLSTRMAVCCCMEEWIDDLEAVVDTLGLEHFPLLGLCQGGAIAITYAVRHPEKVSHLILYGTFARGRLMHDPLPQEVELLNALISLTRVGWSEENPAYRQVFTSLFVPGGSTEQVRWFNDLQRVSTSPENAARLLDAMFRLDVRDTAQNVSAPTLVLHARRDAIVPFRDGQELAALIPNACFVPLESANHILLEHEPAWPHFMAEVRDFIGASPCIPELTAREQDVLELIAHGLDNAEIAERLVISGKTVRNHITNIFSKLQVTSRAQAIVKARNAGLGHSA